MANRTFSDVNALQKAVIFLEGNCVIDSGLTGKTRSVKGSGIKSITNVATGTYKIVFEDAYNRYLGGFSGFVSPVTGNTAITALVSGTVYVIRTLGTSTQANWETAGVPAGVTASVGVPFVAAGVSVGTGSVLTPATSTIVSVKVVGDPNLTLNNSTQPHLIIQTLAATSSSVTTLILTDPVDGSVLGLGFMLRNSSVKGKGEV